MTAETAQGVVVQSGDAIAAAAQGVGVKESVTVEEKQREGDMRKDAGEARAVSGVEDPSELYKLPPELADELQEVVRRAYQELPAESRSSIVLRRGLEQVDIGYSLGNDAINASFELIDRYQKSYCSARFRGTPHIVQLVDNLHFYCSQKHSPNANNLQNTLDRLKAHYAWAAAKQLERTLPKAAAEAPSLESLIGKRDDLLDFAFMERAVNEVAPAVARLTVMKGRGGGTGWLIAPRLLITAQHVLANNGRDAARNLLPYAEGEELYERAKGTTARFDFHRAEDPAYIEVRVEALEFEDSVLDFAILRIADHERISPRSALRVARSPREIAEGTPLNIPQHPKHPVDGGLHFRIAIRNNLCVKTKFLPDSLCYTTTTYGGSSGSPVCDDDWQVIGLHSQSIDARAAHPKEFFNVGIYMHAIVSSLQSHPGSKEKELYEEIARAQGWTKK